MKSGLNLAQLSEKVMAAKAAKVDVIANSKSIHYSLGENDKVEAYVAVNENAIRIAPQERFMRQAAARLRIDKKYFDRMAEEAPDLLVTNMNHWSHNVPERRMLRTFASPVEGGYNAGRAYLSDGFKRLENEDLMAKLLPALGKIGDLTVTDCELTESRLYIKLLCPRVQGEIKVGDVVQAGAIISNSECGEGALKIQPLAFRLICLNGMIVPEGRFRAFHVGKKAEGDEDAFIYSSETQAAENDAILLKARDKAEAIFQPDFFAKLLIPMRAAAEDILETKRPDLAVQVLSDQVGFNEAEQVEVLTHFLQGGDLSRWGLANAVTRTAQDVPSYDRSIALETIGGAMMNMDRRNWKEISEAGE